MKLRLSTTAEQQLRAGYRFYERQTEGLGDYFLDSLMADIESLRIPAGVHEVFFGKYHRMLAKRFPYIDLPVKIRRTETRMAELPSQLGVETLPLEDLKDLAAVAERRDESTISHQDLRDELRKDGLLQPPVEVLREKGTEGVDRRVIRIGHRQPVYGK